MIAHCHPQSDKWGVFAEAPLSADNTSADIKYTKLKRIILKHAHSNIHSQDQHKI